MTEEAKRVFHNTGVQIGLSARVLASVIGDASALNMYCEDKVQKYSKMTEKLRKFARSNPHPVYSCLTKGVQSKLSFMTRTAPEFHLKLDGVENDISEKLIPTLTGRDAPNDTQMELLSLPLRMGGLNIQMPSDYSENFKWSKMNSEPLEKVTPVVAKNIQNRILSDIKIAKERTNKAKLHNIKSKLSEEETYALNLASEKGSLSWLNALLLQRYGFNLTKGGFRDGLCFRYSWETKNTPAKCPCSQKFSLAHALHCPKGWYTIMCHNEIRDTFANLMDEVCHDFQIEPMLQELQGKTFDNKTTCSDEEARPDIKANGLGDEDLSERFLMWRFSTRLQRVALERSRRHTNTTRISKNWNMKTVCAKSRTAASTRLYSLALAEQDPQQVESWKSWQKKLASRRKGATQTPSPTSGLELDSPLLRVLRSA